MACGDSIPRREAPLEMTEASKSPVVIRTLPRRETDNPSTFPGENRHLSMYPVTEVTIALPGGDGPANDATAIGHVDVSRMGKCPMCSGES